VSYGFDPDPLVIDHLLLVTSREHRRRYTRAWRRMVCERVVVREPHIMHESTTTRAANSNRGPSALASSSPPPGRRRWVVLV
jgi:hypothetical protein